MHPQDDDETMDWAAARGKAESPQPRPSYPETEGHLAGNLAASAGLEYPAATWTGPGPQISSQETVSAGNVSASEPAPRSSAQKASGNQVVPFPQGADP